MRCRGTCVVSVTPSIVCDGSWPVEPHPASLLCVHRLPAGAHTGTDQSQVNNEERRMFQVSAVLSP